MQSTKSKKGFIIATAVLVGTLSVGGTVYGIVKSRNLSNTEIAIKNEQLNLSGISSELNKMVAKSGYVLPTATVEKLNSYKNLVNRMKDSYIDFHISKDNLTNELKAVKIGKQSVLNKIDSIESKLSVQDKVNSMFTNKSINGETVSEQPVISSLTADQINKIKNSIAIKEDSQWLKSIQSLIDSATSQVQQIEKAKQLVGGLFQNGQVVAGVTMNGYSQALAEVNNVKNPTVKQDLTNQLNKVLGVVQANEAQSQGITIQSSEGSIVGSVSSNRSSGGGTSYNGGTSSSSSYNGSGSSGQSSGGGTYTKPASTASKPVSSPAPTPAPSTPRTIQSTQTGSGAIKNQNGTSEGGTYTKGAVNGTNITWGNW